MPSTASPITVDELRAMTQMLAEMESGSASRFPRVYRQLSGRLMGALRRAHIDDLLVAARGDVPVLSELAENALFERSACLTVGTLDARRLALQQADALLGQLGLRRD